LFSFKNADLYMYNYTPQPPIFCGSWLSRNFEQVGGGCEKQWLSAAGTAGVTKIKKFEIP